MIFNRIKMIFNRDNIKRNIKNLFQYYYKNCRDSVKYQLSEIGGHLLLYIKNLFQYYYKNFINFVKYQLPVLVAHYLYCIWCYPFLDKIVGKLRSDSIIDRVLFCGKFLLTAFSLSMSLAILLLSSQFIILELGEIAIDNTYLSMLNDILTCFLSLEPLVLFFEELWEYSRGNPIINILSIFA